MPRSNELSPHQKSMKNCWRKRKRLKENNAEKKFGQLRSGLLVSRKKIIGKNNVLKAGLTQLMRGPHLKMTIKGLADVTR